VPIDIRMPGACAIAHRHDAAERDSRDQAVRPPGLRQRPVPLLPFIGLALLAPREEERSCRSGLKPRTEANRSVPITTGHRFTDAAAGEHHGRPPTYGARALLTSASIGSAQQGHTPGGLSAISLKTLNWLAGRSNGSRFRNSLNPAAPAGRRECGNLPISSGPHGGGCALLALRQMAVRIQVGSARPARTPLKPASGAPKRVGESNQGRKEPASLPRLSLSEAKPGRPSLKKPTDWWAGKVKTWLDRLSTTIREFSPRR